MSQQFTIYHNPRCSKSRQSLTLLKANGIEPTVVEYLKTPPSATTLKRILKALGINASDLLRRKEKLFREVCPDGEPSNSESLKIMTKHPTLMERPIVVAGGRAVIGRPPENILKLL